MMVQGHIMIGAAVYIAKRYFYGDSWYMAPGIVIESLCVFLGLLLPDVDHPSSTIGKRVKWLSYPVWAFFGHRGITHSFIFPLLIVFAGHYYNIALMQWVALGVILHLLGDFLTPSGIPLLYPLKTSYRAPITIPTNGIGEAVFCLFAFGLALLYAFNI
jgi:inner membrane protein